MFSIKISVRESNPVWRSAFQPLAACCVRRPGLLRFDPAAWGVRSQPHESPCFVPVAVPAHADTDPGGSAAPHLMISGLVIAAERISVRSVSRSCCCPNLASDPHGLESSVSSVSRFRHTLARARDNHSRWGIPCYDFLRACTTIVLASIVRTDADRPRDDAVLRNEVSAMPSLQSKSSPCVSCQT